MELKNEKAKPLVDTSVFTTKYDDSCDTDADGSLGLVHNPDEVVRPRTEGRMLQRMTTSCDNPHDTLPRLNGIVFSMSRILVKYLYSSQSNS